MSIHYVFGDILKYQVDAIVNPVNCVGVMGAGLALKFKQKYPKMFLKYQKHCENGHIRPGGIMVYDLYKEELRNDRVRYILNIATKNHWKHPSKTSFVENALYNLHEN